MPGTIHRDPPSSLTIPAYTAPDVHYDPDGIENSIPFYNAAGEFRPFALPAGSSHRLVGANEAGFTILGAGDEVGEDVAFAPGKGVTWAAGDVGIAYDATTNRIVSSVPTISGTLESNTVGPVVCSFDIEQESGTNRLAFTNLSDVTLDPVQTSRCYHEFTGGLDVNYTGLVVQMREHGSISGKMTTAYAFAAVNYPIYFVPVSDTYDDRGIAWYMTGNRIWMYWASSGAASVSASSPWIDGVAFPSGVSFEVRWMMHPGHTANAGPYSVATDGATIVGDGTTGDKLKVPADGIGTEQIQADAVTEGELDTLVRDQLLTANLKHKLDGIETGATADQTTAEILAKLGVSAADLSNMLVNAVDDDSNDRYVFTRSDGRTITITYPTASSGGSTPSPGDAISITEIGTANIDVASAHRWVSSGITIPANTDWLFVNFGKGNANGQQAGDWHRVSAVALRALSVETVGTKVTSATGHALIFHRAHGDADAFLGRNAANEMLVTSSVANVDSLGFEVYAFYVTETRSFPSSFSEAAIAPANPSNDDIWLDLNTHKWKYYDSHDSMWREMDGGKESYVFAADIFESKAADATLAATPNVGDRRNVDGREQVLLESTDRSNEVHGTAAVIDANYVGVVHGVSGLTDKGSFSDGSDDTSITWAPTAEGIDLGDVRVPRNLPTFAQGAKAYLLVKWVGPAAYADMLLSREPSNDGTDVYAYAAPSTGVRCVSPAGRDFVVQFFWQDTPQSAPQPLPMHLGNRWVWTDQLYYRKENAFTEIKAGHAITVKDGVATDDKSVATIGVDETQLNLDAARLANIPPLAKDATAGDPDHNFKVLVSELQPETANPKAVTFSAGAGNAANYSGDPGLAGISNILFQSTSGQDDYRRYVVLVATDAAQLESHGIPVLLQVGGNDYPLEAVASTVAGSYAYRTEEVAAADRAVGAVTRQIDIQWQDGTWSNRADAYQTRALTKSELQEALIPVTSLINARDVSALPPGHVVGRKVNLLLEQTIGGVGILKPVAAGNGIIGYFDGDPVYGSMTGSPDNGIDSVATFSNGYAVSGFRNKLVVRRASAETRTPAKLFLNGTEYALTLITGHSYEATGGDASLLHPHTDYAVQVEFGNGDKLYPDVTLQPGIYEDSGLQWIPAPITWTRSQIDALIRPAARAGSNAQFTFADFGWAGTNAEYQALPSTKDTDGILRFTRG